MNSSSAPIKVVIGILLLSVPIFFVYTAMPRLALGLQIEPASRLVQLATFQASIPIDVARSAASAFAKAPSDDGDDIAQAAEFLVLHADGDQNTISRSRQMVLLALAHAPANSGAWTLLCELETLRAPRYAVACLKTNFDIARYDWFTADQRMQIAALEWPYLDEQLRDEAASLVLPMWYTTQWKTDWNRDATYFDANFLRDALFRLSKSDNGRQLLRAGFASDLDALRTFNRYTLEERANGK